MEKYNLASRCVQCNNECPFNNKKYMSLLNQGVPCKSWTNIPIQLENKDQSKKYEYPKVNDVYERIRKRREELNIKI